MRRRPAGRRGRATRGWALAFALACLVAPALGAEIRFRDAAERWGLEFRHHHGGSGARYMAETVVGGVVIFDFDRDGDNDVFFVDGGALPGYEGPAPRSRLFRNEGSGRFVDWSDRAGIDVTAYGSGAAAADIEGDGDLDLYVTALGANQLFRNEGDGSFRDVTAGAGVGDDLWGASAAFADLDGDGTLDLYVANYVDFRVDSHKPCSTAGRVVYCHPGAYDGLPDRFYRGRGDGTFEEAAAKAGLTLTPPRAGLGVAVGDLDDDGLPDLYVANDAEPNALFFNRGGGRFEEAALLSGVAYGDTGRPEAGMGVDLGDVDGDGRLDIVVTNFELETNALYRNLGSGLFSDSRFAYNVAEISLLDLAFGVALADFDQDGDLDAAFANGHILDNAGEMHERSRYAQPNRVLENLGGGRFSPLADAGLDAVRVSRGLATGDLDGDGDLDLAIVNSNDLAEVYENVSAPPGGWLEVDLVAAGGNRDGLGARLTLSSASSQQVREVRSAASYLSQSALTAHFGTGAAAAGTLEIRWPDGRRQRLERLPAGRRIQVSEPLAAAVRAADPEPPESSP